MGRPGIFSEDIVMPLLEQVDLVQKLYDKAFPYVPEDLCFAIEGLAYYENQIHLAIKEGTANG